MNERCGQFVYYTDIDTKDSDGHRFCEGKKDNPLDEKSWLWKYPYSKDGKGTQTGQKYLDLLSNVSSWTFSPGSPQVLEPLAGNRGINADDNFFLAHPSMSEMSGHDEQHLWSAIGDQFKLFHPKPIYHELITDRILKLYRSQTLTGYAG